MSKIRIVVVDDHQVVRQGLRYALSGEADMEIVGEARSGEEAVTQAQLHRPDLMLLDAKLDDMDGPEVCQRVVTVAPKTAVVILTSYLHDATILRSLVAGAKGYIVKDVEIADLKKMIRAVYRGNAVLDPRVTPHIIATVAGGRARRSKTTSTSKKASLLSETDLTIIRHLSHGLSNKEIAAQVHLSPHTVKDRLEKIRESLDARSRTEIVAAAFRTGLLISQ